MWSTPSDAASRFYDSNLKSAVGLLSTIAADRRSRGSGRPPGQPQAEWRAVLVLALAALEAGLVDVGLAAHHHRISNQTTALGGGAATAAELTRARGRLLNSLPLSAPNAQKIEGFMLAQFGVLRSMIVVPSVAHFTARRKPQALGRCRLRRQGAFRGRVGRVGGAPRRDRHQPAIRPFAEIAAGAEPCDVHGGRVPLAFGEAGGRRSP